MANAKSKTQQEQYSKATGCSLSNLPTADRPHMYSPSPTIIITTTQSGRNLPRLRYITRTMTSSPSTTTTPTPPVIPTIDIGPFLDGSDKNGVAQQINEACTTIGFFMVRNKTKTETETPRGCRLYI